MAFTSTSANKRIIYATQAVAVGDIGATAVQDSWTPASGGSYSGVDAVMLVHGLQSCGISTNFNLEAIQEYAQLSLYENYEEVPDVEITMEKVLDGYSLLYHLATVDAINPTLAGRSDARADVRVAVGLTTDTAVTAGDATVAEMYASGTYVSSASYTLGSDGNFTESVTLVGNDKEWFDLDNVGTGATLLTSAGVVVGEFGSIFGDDAPTSPDASVLRRQNLVTGSGPIFHNTTVEFRTVVPDFIPGVTTGGSGVVNSSNGDGLATNCGYIEAASGVYINSVSVSVDLGREQINTLGQKLPYYRYVSFPVDVTTDIEVTAAGGDSITAQAEAKNLSNHSIQFCLDDSTVLSLGNKNKVTSVTYGGGDTGGGNTTVAYSMTNTNDLVVLHSGDPASIIAADYWTNHF